MNLIVMIADSLRADHLGCYGNRWIRTPKLDHFASESAVFRYSYPENVPTVPARATWFTGRYNFPFSGWEPFRVEDVTLAEYLWDKGFTSAMITDVFHFHKPGMNMNRGFDYTEFIRGQEDDPHVLDDSIEVELEKYHKSDGVNERWTHQTVQYLRNRAHWKSEEDHFVARVVKAGMKWLDSVGRRDRIFLWLDCFDPHEPWDPPAEYTRMYDPDYKGIEIINPIVREVEGYLTAEELKHIKAQYAGEVSLVDKWAGVFLDYLREEGFFEDSMIIFTSDHGEPFGEHGMIRKGRAWPYEELMRIPFIIYAPGEKPLVSDAIAQTCDLMPTALDFLGVEEPGWVEGESLLPVMRGEKGHMREFAYCGHYGHSWTVRNAEWNFAYYLEPQRPAGRYHPEDRELFHLREDPTEQENVIGEFPEVAERMELELLRFVSELKAKREPVRRAAMPKWREWRKRGRG